MAGILDWLREVQANGKITGEAWRGEIRNGLYRIIRQRL
jgi:hypothetical protein